MKITIFGLAGTGTSTVGNLLAEKLGYKFLSTGDIFFRKKAKELSITLSELHRRATDDPSIDRECDDEVKKFGEENDDFIVESRLAWHFIPDSIKIKLATEFDTRVKRLALRDQLSFEDAEKHITEREEIDNARYEKFYGIEDINSNDHFDLVVDADAITPEEIVGKIISFVDKKR